MKNHANKVLAYQLPSLSHQELETMFTLTDWKKTRFYQEAFAEGKTEGKAEGKAEAVEQFKLETVPKLLASGLTIEQVESILSLDIFLIENLAQSVDSPSPTGITKVRQRQPKKSKK